MTRPIPLFVLAVFLLSSACAATAPAPLPPSTPPIPTTPPPIPPERLIPSARVSGQVLDRDGRPVAHAMVLVRTADAACRPLDSGIGAVTDERGEFYVRAQSEDQAAACVVAEARSGGASGEGTDRVPFTLEGSVSRVEVRLDRVETLTFAAAERLVRQFAAAINQPSTDSSEVALHILHGPEALRVALDHYRSLLGEVRSVATLPQQAHDPRRFPFELTGSNGRRMRMDVYQEVLTRLHSGVIDYGFRSERFMHSYLRAISSGDAIRLSQVLNPDDIDFPVERAREIIIGYRHRYRDTASIRAEFVDIQEERATITWRLRGPGPAGDEVTELIHLGYGDGLIGVRGLNP